MSGGGCRRCGVVERPPKRSEAAHGALSAEVRFPAWDEFLLLAQHFASLGAAETGSSASPAACIVLFLARTGSHLRRAFANSRSDAIKRSSIGTTSFTASTGASPPRIRP